MEIYNCNYNYFIGNYNYSSNNFSVDNYSYKDQIGRTK